MPSTAVACHGGRPSGGGGRRRHRISISVTSNGSDSCDGEGNGQGGGGGARGGGACPCRYSRFRCPRCGGCDGRTDRGGGGGCCFGDSGEGGGDGQPGYVQSHTFISVLAHNQCWGIIWSREVVFSPPINRLKEQSSKQHAHPRSPLHPLHSSPCRTTTLSAPAPRPARTGRGSTHRQSGGRAAAAGVRGAEEGLLWPADPVQRDALVGGWVGGGCG